MAGTERAEHRTMSAPGPPVIVGMGEALFDVFSDRTVLGGAPLNVAVHAQQLAGAAGGRGVPVSRVGSDELGRRLLDELRQRSVTTEYLQLDEARPTGRVLVELRGGEPSYDIVRNVAWDFVEWTEPLGELAASCGAVCFGTLAQRNDTSRESIRRFLKEAQRAVRMFDVNLRQAYFSEEILRRSCELATVVKLNEEELPRVCELLGLNGGRGAAVSQDSQAAALREAFGLDAVVLTRGSLGTAFYNRQGRTVGEPVACPPAEGADSVGAGDACSAGILVGMLLGWEPKQIVELANRIGAFVASQPGATPTLPEEMRIPVALAGRWANN